MIWEKGAVAGKRKGIPFLSPVSLFSCSHFLNFADPTIAGPRTVYVVGGKPVPASASRFAWKRKIHLDATLNDVD